MVSCFITIAHGTWLITHTRAPCCGELAALQRRKHLQAAFPKPRSTSCIGRRQCKTIPSQRFEDFRDYWQSPAGVWKPPNMARPHLPQPAPQAGKTARVGVHRPQELLVSLAGVKWRGTVQSGPGFELLLWPTPQGPSLSLCVSPACGYHPCICFLKNLPRKNPTNPEAEEEMGAEAKHLWVVLAAPARPGWRG